MSTPATTTDAAPGAALPKSYVPVEHEDAVLARWDASGLWHAEPGSDRPAYAILIPPPNVTAALHLGHAMNNTVQDILVRVHRMKGFNTLWMPGTDHAGIATQTVVEKRLMAQGKRRLDFSREDFVAHVQAWKDEYEATITDQLRRMGCSCDWDRQRFTMDDLCARAVMEGFFRLFRDGLVYRGKRLVNWDPVTLTALADDEVEMKEVEGSFWYLKYPVVDDEGHDTGEFVTVATTRPETMLGDTAVAVNPDDADRARFAGRRVRLPIVGRIIPVIADDYVIAPNPESSDSKARYASGFLKVTPAHDPNDWEIGQRHELEAINVMAPDGSISDRHGWDDVSEEAQAFVGLSREDAREAIVRWFREHDLLAEVRPYAHSVGHSYRSHVPVEPYLSDQWYVRVTDDRLVGEAQRALDPEQFEGRPPARAAGEDPHGDDGTMAFFPPRYARSYQAWHENLRDWCISRQLWWGHRIPVWWRTFADADEAETAAGEWRSEAGATPGRLAVTEVPTGDGVQVQVCVNVGVDGTDAITERLDAAGFTRDEDVLDTWFSSGLWPLSTMGWPSPAGETEGLLEAFNPTSVLCTGRDIITLWVSRMVMFNRHFNEQRVPFRHVYINPMIQDGHGQRMSKSLGNGVDPRDIIHSHGADAMRFTVAGMATGTQDAKLPVDMVSPWTGETFAPKEITTAAGHRVSAPEQTCPKTGKPMVSAYGVAAGAATPTDEAPLARNTSSKFDQGRNFCNKLWNATRFALGTISEPAGPDAVTPADRPLVDRWILSRLARTVGTVDAAVADYQFAVYAGAMYDLVWRDVCDWYLEAIKPTVRDDAEQQQVLRTVLDGMLRLLHPLCPFVTETIWPAVQAGGPAGVGGLNLEASELLAGAAWPDPAAATSLVDEEAESIFGRMQELVGAIRTERSRNDVPPKRRIVLHAPDEVRALLARCSPVAEALAGLEAIEPIPAERPAGAIPLAFEGAELLLSGIVDAVDVGAERERLGQLVAEKEKAIRGYRGKLDNAGYVAKAPADVVQETRDRLAEAEADLEAARQALGALPPA
jgi:valyl-tRNA synthetase